MRESRSAERLLIVEDEGITAIDTADLLRGLGYDVVGLVYAAEDAIAQVEAQRPDLVLMDIRLRGAMDGIAATACRSSSRPPTPTTPRSPARGSPSRSVTS
jgi:CheY-like chemotaxis protein